MTKNKKVKGYERIMAFSVGVNAKNGDEADKKAKIVAESIVKSLNGSIPIRRLK